MFLQRWILASALSFLPNMVLAEGRCPPGMFETGSRDYLACAPIPGYGGDSGDDEVIEQAPIPTVWEARWGAIATESKGGGFGAVRSFKSEASASQSALEQCRATASITKANCAVQLTYRNQCAVYAWGNGKSMASSAVDIPAATESALKLCGAASGGTCKIYYSGCSYAEAVPK